MDSKARLRDRAGGIKIKFIWLKFKEKYNISQAVNKSKKGGRQARIINYQASKQEQKRAHYGYSGTKDNLARDHVCGQVYTGKLVRELAAGVQAGGDQVSGMAKDYCWKGRE